MGSGPWRGWMFRLLDVRPIKIDFECSGTTTGRPGEGIGSGLCWAWYHAGSIQTSATQWKVAGEETVLPLPVVGAGIVGAGCT